MNRALSYHQVALIPKYGIAPSRKLCDVSVNFLDRKFELPIIPANMKCSISYEKARWFIKNNLFYIMHRFEPYDDIINWVKDSSRLVSLSIGVQDRDIELIKNLSKNAHRVDVITIDVAHGHCKRVLDMVNLIQCLNWSRAIPRIIVGNIASPIAAEAISHWGVDAIKVGIGQGHVCTTRLETGFGMPMFTCIKECAGATHLPIIADGGISHFGDAVKAIVAGATMVMSGSMFARCLDSPAETVQPGPYTATYKRWYGSASEENKGKDEYVEGKCVFEEVSYATYEEMLRKWKEALQSAVSYSGGVSLKDLQRVQFKEV